MVECKQSREVYVSHPYRSCSTRSAVVAIVTITSDVPPTALSENLTAAARSYRTARARSLLRCMQDHNLCRDEASRGRMSTTEQAT